MPNNGTRGNGQKILLQGSDWTLIKIHLEGCNWLLRGSSWTSFLEVVKSLNPQLNCSSAGKSPALSRRMDFPTNTPAWKGQLGQNTPTHAHSPCSQQNPLELGGQLMVENQDLWGTNCWHMQFTGRYEEQCTTVLQDSVCNTLTALESIIIPTTIISGMCPSPSILS